MGKTFNGRPNGSSSRFIFGGRRRLGRMLTDSGGRAVRQKIQKLLRPVKCRVNLVPFGSKAIEAISEVGRQRGFKFGGHGFDFCKTDAVVEKARDFLQVLDWPPVVVSQFLGHRF